MAAKVAKPPKLQRERPVLPWTIAILLVVSASLSAVAFWQSTEYSQLSADSTNQARIAQADHSRVEAAIRAQLAHDVETTAACDVALARRADAIADNRFYGDEVARVAVRDVAQALSAIRLHFVIMPSSCAGATEATVAEAIAIETFFATGGKGVPSYVQLLDQATRMDRGELLAVVSAAIAAMALVGLTFAENVRSPRRAWRWVQAAVVLASVGFGLIVAAGVAAGRGLVEALGILVLVAGLLVALAWAVKRASLWAKIRRLRAGHSIRWWAEVLGSITVLLLTFAVLGSAYTASAERVLTAEADTLSTEAINAQSLGLDVAFATLDGALELDRLDAAEQTTGDSAARAALVGSAWPAIERSWEVALDRFGTGAPSAAGSDLGCINRDELLLPWKRAGLGGDSYLEGVAADYRERMPDLAPRLVALSATAGSVCSTQASVTLQSALAVGDVGAKLQTAVVIFGLAGFLFAVASPRGHQVRRRWLMAAAATGLVFGIAVSTWAISQYPAPPTQDQLVNGSLAYVAANVAEGCDEKEALSLAATRSLPLFAPAHVRMVDALLCEESSVAWSSSWTPSQIEASIGSLERAVLELRSEDPVAKSDLGWLMIALSILNDDRPLASRGEQLTEEALAADPANPYFCFNWAFAAAVRGDADLAADRYGHALLSLDGVESSGLCEAAAFDSETLRVWVRMNALNDLERLPDFDLTDPLRSLIVGGARSFAEVDLQPAYSIEPWESSVGVVDLAGVVPDNQNACLVWYYRPSADGTWAIMENPTFGSLWTVCDRNIVSRYPVGVLERGEYRIDVYENGTLTATSEALSYWDAFAGELEPADYRDVVVSHIGVSAVVPATWTITNPNVEGTVAFVGGAGEAAALGRLEGVSDEILGEVTANWVGATLASLGAPTIASDALVLCEDQSLTSWVSFAYCVPDRPGLRVGVQQWPYEPTEDPEAFRVEPGSAWFVLIETSTPAISEAIWFSVVTDI